VLSDPENLGFGALRADLAELGNRRVQVSALLPESGAPGGP